MSKERKIRALVAKPGLDGHDRGARILALGLRDEGFLIPTTCLKDAPARTAEAVRIAEVVIIPN